MTRFFIYLFPAAIDLLIASTAFVCSVRGAEAGWDSSKIASLFAAAYLTYMIVCQVVARIVTPQNATRLLIGSCILLAATSAAFIIFPDPKTMHYLMVPIAVGTGFFFAPFQVFMKAFNQARHRSVAYSAGLFLFAWSAGFAIGPFVAGFLWKLVNWEACHALNIVVEVGTAAGVYFFEHRVHARPAPQSPQPAAAPAGKLLDYSRMPNLAWLGWLCGGLSVATFTLFRSIMPSSSVEYQISKPELGTVFFVASAARAFTGLCLCRSRSWMYRPMAVGAFGLLGMAGLLVVAGSESPWAFACGAGLHGIYIGAFFFYLSFHSLIHPTKSSRYVSFYESVIGAANILGAFMAGYLADTFGLRTAYMAGAGIVLIVIIVQGIVNSRNTECVRELLRQ